jgi:hypothetical protein
MAKRFVSPFLETSSDRYINKQSQNKLIKVLVAQTEVRFKLDETFLYRDDKIQFISNIEEPNEASEGTRSKGRSGFSPPPHPSPNPPRRIHISENTHPSSLSCVEKTCMRKWIC